ncbi:hypothetical protein H2031_002557 [Shigella sonnei]|nr:hypothetical protein [Shigella sonnei]EHV2473252.1 helix-turn-helix domain-containing protein [Escherichia coli]
MYKKDVIDHFGTQRAVAKALGISDAAVSQWKEDDEQFDDIRVIRGVKVPGGRLGIKITELENV